MWYVKRCNKIEATAHSFTEAVDMWGDLVSRFGFNFYITNVKQGVKNG